MVLDRGKDKEYSHKIYQFLNLVGILFVFPPIQYHNALQ